MLAGRCSLPRRTTPRQCAIPRHNRNFFESGFVCVVGINFPHLPDILTLFSIASSLAASHILAVSSVKTTPVRRSSVRGVKCSGTNFPSEISVPFETNSQSLFTYRALLMSSCTRWKHALWAPVAAGAWRRHTLFCRCPVVPLAGLPPSNLRPISRHRLHTVHKSRLHACPISLF